MSTTPDLTMTGNLTGDPELRFTASGVAVANFTVAYTPRRKADDGKYVDGTTLFMRCNAWRHLAEHVAESLGKGARVTVRGELVQREWETDKGEKRYAVELRADEVAASLQYATASVKRAARSNGDDVPPPADPWTGEAADQRDRPASADA